jgi:Ni,Fe-hydrogenase III large subunit/Ni,Fe-hydrogenase III component G
MPALNAERLRLRTAADEEFYSPAANQVVLLTRTPELYRNVADELRRDGYFLATSVANDEHELADNCYKLYTVFSHPSQDLFVTLMLPLGRGSTTFPSLASLFATAMPFESEIVGRFNLSPVSDSTTPSVFQHPMYPTELAPLRRVTTTAAIRAALDSYTAPFTTEAAPAPLPSGELDMPIGPIHAGVIEPGHFRFRIAGEVIEKLDLRLGYAHKGVERLFQINYTLGDGWKLAERIVGDSALAHSLAYCRALESLTSTEVPLPAKLLRALFLELERLCNHMGDCTALAHDVALDLPASEMAVPREALLRLNEQLSGHRLLRGLNRPGGVVLPAPLNPEHIQSAVRLAVDRFLPVARFLLTDPGFRGRLMGIGVLTREIAEHLGVTGLTARASGLARDWRQIHPADAEALPEIRDVLQAGAPEEDLYAASERTAGDAYARYAARVGEIVVAARVIERVLDLWESGWTETEFCAEVNLRHVHNFRFVLGYAEGWRGPVVYWLMKDKFDRIYRCKACDPSFLNWPALRAAVEPHVDENDKSRRFEILLADFPVVNKSFNLSYAGNDL